MNRSPGQRERMSDDQPFTAPNRKPPPPRRPRQTEHLWAIRRGDRQFDCELLDHGTHGVEMQVLRDREWFYGHRHDSRELALREAEERKGQYLREGGVVVG